MYIHMNTHTWERKRERERETNRENKRETKRENREKRKKKEKKEEKERKKEKKHKNKERTKEEEREKKKALIKVNHSGYRTTCTTSYYNIVHGSFLSYFRTTTSLEYVLSWTDNITCMILLVFPFETITDRSHILITINNCLQNRG